VPAALARSTAKAAALVAAGQAAAVSTTAVLLMKGVLKTMLLKKLRLAAGAGVVLLALGAVGVRYHTSGAGAAPAPPPGQPKNEVEALRHENELLKLNLEVVLEKVRAQEGEIRDLRARPVGGKGTGMGSGMPGSSGMLGMTSGGNVGLMGGPVFGGAGGITGN